MVCTGNNPVPTPVMIHDAQDYNAQDYDLVTIQIYSGGTIKTVSYANWPPEFEITGPFKMCYKRHILGSKK